MSVRWSDETREEALGMLRAGIGNQECSRRTGVPSPTLSRWAHDAGIVAANAAQVEAANGAVRLAWAARRGELTDALGEVAAELLDKARNAGGQDARAFMIAAAVGIDKAQLLSGGATSRHEQLDAQRRRERVEALQDELSERRAAKDGTTGG